MTTPTGPDLPPDDLVELASALVDDVLTPAERLGATESAEVRALADRFDTLRAGLGAPIPVDPARREAHLAAALEAFPGSLEGSTVVSLESAREQLARRRARRLAPVLAAAAAIAAVGIVAGSIANRDSGGSSVSADAVSEVTAEASSTARSGAQPSPEVEPGVAASERIDSLATTKPEAAVDVIASAAPPLEGRSPAEIPTLVAAALEQRATSRQTDPDATCTDVRGEPIASITWNGAAAVLTVAPSIDAPTEAFVIDATTCSVIASATLSS